MEYVDKAVAALAPQSLLRYLGLQKRLFKKSGLYLVTFLLKIPLYLVSFFFKEWSLSLFYILFMLFMKLGSPVGLCVGFMY